MSCVESTRVAVSAKLIRTVHPNAHIVCGGPFVTALPGETLKHYREIDTVVIGEGEETFFELIRRLERGESTEGSVGTACRRGDWNSFSGRHDSESLTLTHSPRRSTISLTGYLVTSRGCPGECTFCGSKVMWGRKVTFHSVDYVLDMLQKAVIDYGQKVIASRMIPSPPPSESPNICRGIIRRKLNFVWSCDTRVNVLDEEVLYFMRLGMPETQPGVESASPFILKNIKKHISPKWS